MAIKPRRKPAAAQPALPQIRESSLKVFDIPLELLLGDEMNPNEMAEDKFDMLVQEIQESGFDEPLQVIPHPRQEGYYLIAGGHHRKKAAATIGMDAVPCVIKEGWTEDQQKFALVKRNIMKGKTNSQKFTTLYNELSKKYDGAILQTMLGFTQKKEFEAVYDGVEKNLTPKQKVALANAKENIKSVDDLTAVLHKIFKEEGSESDHSYVIFSHLGKQHHYIKVDDEAAQALERLKKTMDKQGKSMTALIHDMIKQMDMQSGTPVRKKLKATSRK